MTVQALQDYDYMEQRGADERDPFLITGERVIDRQILVKAMGGMTLDNNPFDENPRPVPVRWEHARMSSVSTRRDNRHRKFFVRVSVAAVGAAFLIGPMWLLIKVFDTMVALWSTTVFVGVFGLMMACVLQDNIAVLSATAAYAAVLVVFVALVAETDRT